MSRSLSSPPYSLFLSTCHSLFVPVYLAARPHDHLPMCLSTSMCKNFPSFFLSPDSTQLVPMHLSNSHFYIFLYLLCVYFSLVHAVVLTASSPRPCTHEDMSRSTQTTLTHIRVNTCDLQRLLGSEQVHSFT